MKRGTIKNRQQLNAKSRLKAASRVTVEAMEDRVMMTTVTVAAWSFYSAQPVGTSLGTISAGAPTNPGVSETNGQAPGTASPTLEQVGMNIHGQQPYMDITGTAGTSFPGFNEDLWRVRGTPIIYTISSGSITSGVATITLSTAHNYQQGDYVDIASSNASFNITDAQITAITATTISYTDTASNIATTPLTGTVGSDINTNGANNGWISNAANASQGAEIDLDLKSYTALNNFNMDWYSTGSGIKDLALEYNPNVANPNGWLLIPNTNVPGTYYGGANPLIAVSGDYYSTNNPIGASSSPTNTINLSGITLTPADTAGTNTFGIRMVAQYDPTFFSYAAGNAGGTNWEAYSGSGNDSTLFSSAGSTSPTKQKTITRSGNWRFGNISITGSAPFATITQNPATTTVNAAVTATFTAAATGSTSVQWQVSTNGGVSWTNDTTDSGNTTNTLSVVASSTNSGNEYRAAYTNASGTDYTTAATLQVNAATALVSSPSTGYFTSQDVRLTGVPDNTVPVSTFIAQASGFPAPTVTWQISTNNGGSWSAITNAPGGVPTANQDPSSFLTTNSPGWVTSNPAYNQTISALSVCWLGAPNNAQYRAVFTNNGGATLVNSGAATMTMLPTPQALPTGSSLPPTNGPFEDAITAWNFGTQIFNSSAYVGGTPGNSTNPAPSMDLTGTGHAQSLGMTFIAGNTDASSIGSAGNTSSDGFDAGNSWSIGGSIEGWNNTAPIGTQGAQFIGSTAGFQDVYVKFDLDVSTQGEGDMMVEYTTDGINYTAVPAADLSTNGDVGANTNGQPGVVIVDGTSSAINPVSGLPSNTDPNIEHTGGYFLVTGAASWYNGLTANLSQIPGVSNNPNFGIKIVNAGTGIDATNSTAVEINNTSGGDQFDEVQITGLALTTRTPTITLQPSSYYVATVGNSASFTAAASDSGGDAAPTVQWQVLAPGGAWTNLTNSGVYTGATTNTLNVSSSTGLIGYQYRAAYTDPNSNPSFPTNTSAVTLGVAAAPGVPTSPAAAFLPSSALPTTGNAASSSFYSSDTGSPAPTIQWQVNNGGGWANDTTDSGNTTNYLTVAPSSANAVNGYQFRAVFSNPTTPGGVPSAAARLSMLNTQVAAWNFTSDSNNTSTNLNLSPAPSTGNATGVVTIGVQASGTFNLTVNDSAGAFAVNGNVYNITAAALQTALQGSGANNAGNFIVSGLGTVASPFVVTLAGDPGAFLSGSGASLGTPANFSLKSYTDYAGTVGMTTSGSSKVTLGGQTSGTFTLSVTDVTNSYTTAPLAFNSTPSAIQSALQGLGSPSTNAGSFTVVSSGPPTVTLGTQTSGTFSLAVYDSNGTDTTGLGALAYNITGPNLQLALRSCGAVNAASITVTGAGTTASPFVVSFPGNTNAFLTGSGSSLTTPANFIISNPVTVTLAGDPGAVLSGNGNNLGTPTNFTVANNAVVDDSVLLGGATSGNFTLTVTDSTGTYTTPSLAFNATSANVQTAIQALNSTTSTATVSGSAGTGFIVVLTSDATASLSGNSGTLAGGTTPFTVSSAQFPTTGATGPDASKTGSPVTFNNGTTASSDGIGGKVWTIDGNNGYNSAAAIGTQGAEFLAPTNGGATGFTGIVAKFDLYASTQGEGQVAVEYTTNGSTWTALPAGDLFANGDAGVAVVDGSSGSGKTDIAAGYFNIAGGAGWYNGLTANLSGIAPANNQANFGIRIVNAATAGGVLDATGKGQFVNSAGKWSVDEVQIDSTPSAVVTITAPAGVTYGTALAAPVVTVTENGSPLGSPAYTLDYVGSGGYNSSTPPTAAGTYTVSATYAGDNNYGPGVGVSASFKITAATLTANLSSGVNEFFNGTNTFANAIITLTGVLPGDVGNVSAAGTLMFAGSNAGNYPGGVTLTYASVVLAGSASGNYAMATVPASITGSGTILQVTPSAVTAIAPSTTVYTGSPIAASATVSDVNSVPQATLDTVAPVVNYYMGVGTGTSLGTTAPTAAGTYTIQASFPGSTNYLPATGLTVTYTIAKATPLAVTAIAPGSFVYTGSPIAYTATATGIVGGAVNPLDGVAPVLTYVGTGSTVYASSTTAPTTAGTYSVTPSFPGSTNYAGLTGSAIAFSITKAAPIVTSPVNPVSITYGTALASSQLLGNGANASVAGTFTYTTAAGTVLPYSASAYSENVTFTPTDSVDYSTVTSATVNVSVAKATPTVTVIAPANLTYTGSPIAATATVTGVTGGPTTSIDSPAVAPVVNYYSGVGTGSPLGTTAPSAAGTYTIVATFAGSTNYGPASSSQVTYTVGKVNAKLAIVGNPTTILVGKPFTISGTVQGMVGAAGGTLETVPVVITYYAGVGTGGANLGSTQPSTVGTYTIVLSFAGSTDYNAASISQTFVISPPVAPSHNTPSSPGSVPPTRPTNPTPVAPNA